MPLSSRPYAGRVWADQFKDCAASLVEAIGERALTGVTGWLRTTRNGGRYGRTPPEGC